MTARPINRTTCTLSCLTHTWPVLRLSGREALSEPCHFELVILSNTALPDTLLGQSACLILGRRQRCGVITRLEDQGQFADGQQCWQVTVESRVVLLKTRYHATVWTDKTILQVASSLLTQQCYPYVLECDALTHSYPVHAIITQLPHESDYDCLHRLLSRSGIFYWFDPEGGIHFSDAFSTQQRVRSGQGVYLQSIDYQQVPSHITQSDMPEAITLECISAQARTHNHTRTFKQAWFGLGVEDTKQAQTLANRFSERAELCARQVIAFSARSTIACGQHLNLHAPDFQIHTASPHTVIAITHHYKQAVGRHNEGSQTVYRNQLRLVATSPSFQSEIVPYPQFESSYPATVLSEDDVPTLDKQGRYATELAFDRCARPLSLQPRLRALSSLAGVRSQKGQGASGLHFPLQGGSKVAVGCLMNSPDRLFIMASFAKAGRSLVTAANAKDNILTTQAGFSMNLSCDPHKPSIALTSRHGENQLLLGHKDAIKLKTATGTIEFNTKQTLQSLSRSTEINRFTQSLNAEVGKSFVLQAGRSHWHAATISLQSKQLFSLHCKGDSDWSADKNCQLIAKGDCTMTAKGRRCLWQADKGSINLQSQGNITLNQSGGRLLTVSSSGAALSLSRDGGVYLRAHTVGLSASGGVAYLGKQVRKSKAVPSVHAPRPLSLLPPEVPALARVSTHNISNLRWRNKSARIAEENFAEFNVSGFKGGETGLVIIYQCTANSLTASDSQENRIAITSHQFTLTPDQNHYEIAWGCKPPPTQTPSTQRYCYYRFEVQINNCLSYTLSGALTLLCDVLIHFKTDKNLPIPPQCNACINPTNEKGHSYFSSESRQVAVYNDTVCFKQLALGHRYALSLYQASDHNCQSLELLNEHYQDLSYRRILSLSPQPKPEVALSVYVLTPPIIVNARDDVSPQDERDVHKPLLKEELRYFQKNGNNITIFVHGYNVKAGKFGKHYLVEDQHNKPFTTADATVYRRASLPYDKTINGTDARGWVTHLEHNLNTAAGFDQKSYQRFTRLCHFFWNGSPFMPTDYYRAVLTSKQIARRFALLIQQIKRFDPSMQINIIAHSQGNAVVVTALEELITHYDEHEKRLPCLDPSINAHHCIHRLILWEAAIANTSLSPHPWGRKPFTSMTEAEKNDYLSERRAKHWYCPFAEQAVRTITVLYSHNDNILGPLPDKQPDAVPSQRYVHQQKQDLAELAFGEIATRMGWQSLYEVVDLLEIIPTKLFFSEDYLGYIYKQLRRRFHLYGHPDSLSELCMMYRRQGHLQEEITHNLKKLERVLKRVEGIALSAGYGLESILLCFSRLFVIKTRIQDYNFLRNPPFIAVPTLSESITCLCKLIQEEHIKPQHAMGWSGMDPDTLASLKDKAQNIDQTAWLYSHSAMIMPNELVQQYVYRDVFFSGKEAIHFGHYQ